MAKRRLRRSTSVPSASEPQTTGRFIALLREGASPKRLGESLGVRVAHASDFDKSAVRVDALADSGAVVLDELGVAIINAEPEQHNQLQAMAAETNSDILAIEPERIMYALQSGEYWVGFRDGVADAVGRILSGPADAVGERFEHEEEQLDESRVTWGLQATRVINSRFTGRGVRIAVLDTGLDLNHPDFQGRSIASQSFVQGQAVQDGHGHGTHCIGTATGPATPPLLPRYGIASAAQIFAGKVLSNQGSGGDAGILAGINWAVANKCQVVSMSLGAPVQVGEPFSQVYEGVAQRSLAAGTLIVAAAGNESRRPGMIMPVGRPANCPSIFAVGAVDVDVRVALFSNRSLNPNGGQVDIAAPGVNVRSTWPMPRRYNTISGTSMATPHVAGIAALWVEAQKVVGSRLWAKLTQSARRLALPSVDVGTGLVQAP